jgi:hypothetical protein
MTVVNGWISVPAQFRCSSRGAGCAFRTCEDSVGWDRGRPTDEATVAQLLVPKMPAICRSTAEPRCAQQGIDLDHSTSADWVVHAVWHQRQLHERPPDEAQRIAQTFADEQMRPRRPFRNHAL